MSAPATPLPQRVTTPAGAPLSASAPSTNAVAPAQLGDGSLPPSATSPRDPSAARAARLGDADSQEAAHTQYKAGRLLHAGSDPMLSHRTPTPLQTDMNTSMMSDMPVRPISTGSSAFGVEYPPSTGLVGMSPSSASASHRGSFLYPTGGEPHSAVETPQSDSMSSVASLQLISPVQLSPRQPSAGAATLPPTPANGLFPFNSNYHMPRPSTMSGGGYPTVMPDVDQSGMLAYHSAPVSVESNDSAFGYNLTSYMGSSYGGTAKNEEQSNSLGLTNSYTSSLAQQALSNFTQQFYGSTAWAAPQPINYIAPETIQPSPDAKDIGTASRLLAMSPTPSDSDDTGDEHESPLVSVPTSAPASDGGAFALQQDKSAARAESIRPKRRATLGVLQPVAESSRLNPRRSTRRRSSVGMSLRARAPHSEALYSGKLQPLVLTEEDRERYEREAAALDASRQREMQEFEQGPLKGNRKERRRMQNRLAQRSFRARSKIQGQEALNHMQHLEALTEAQQTHLMRLQEDMENLQRENAKLKTERWGIMQQVASLGLKMPEGLANFSVSSMDVVNAAAGGGGGDGGGAGQDCSDDEFARLSSEIRRRAMQQLGAGAALVAARGQATA